VPLAFSSQLYDLHLHINVVRQRLAFREKLAEMSELKAAE
jgi:hypothetical protein